MTVREPPRLLPDLWKWNKSRSGLAFDHHPQGDAIGIFDHAETALPHADMLGPTQHRCLRKRPICEQTRPANSHTPGAQFTVVQDARTWRLWLAVTLHIRAEAEPLPLRRHGVSRTS